MSKSGKVFVANKNKTHCNHGHEFTPDNTWYEKDSTGAIIGRKCRICREASALKTKAKRTRLERVYRDEYGKTFYQWSSWGVI